MKDSKSTLVLVVVMFVVSLLALVSNNSFAFTSPYVTSSTVAFKSKTFVDTLLNAVGGIDNIISHGTPDFTTHDGTGIMYAAPDDYGTSYYFRSGGSAFNWVLFAGYYWRIIRINGDGSVRLMYSGSTAPTSSQGVSMTGTGTQIGTLAFNSTYSRAEYAGYMYTLNNAHGYGTGSTIKINSSYGLDKWYQNHLASYASYLTDTLFCADRGSYHDAAGTTTGGGTGTSTAYFNAYIRLVTNKEPSLLCPNKNDRFTVNDTTMGNGALTYPIGLITADEVAMAGGKYQHYYYNYYLYTNQDYWTMTPGYVYNGKAQVFFVRTNGSLLAYDAGDTLGVRPVINVRGNVSVTGSGWYDDPYVIS